MKFIALFLLSVVSVNTFAADSLFNMEKRRSVIALAKDPKIPAYARYTYVYELCFKGDAKTAFQVLKTLKDLEVILSDSETDLFVSAKLVNETIGVRTFSSKVQDEGENPYSTTFIKKCNF